ncbi:MAG: hypothetical protein ACRDBP_13950, partial [Luteolibacter sp.]
MAGSICPLGASPGEVDPAVTVRFETGGEVRSVIRQADGKFLAAGGFSHMNGVARGKIARIHADGSLDTLFDPGPINPDIYDRSKIFTLSMQGDKVLAGGYLTHLAGQPASGLVRLNADGTRDATFNPPAFTSTSDSTVYAAVDRGDGKIVAGGYFFTVGGAARPYLVKLEANGAIDATFNPAVNGTVNALLPVSGDRWLIGGNFTTVSGNPIRGIARIHADGTRDTSFTTVPLPASTSIEKLALQADGKIIYTGYAGFPRFVGRALADGGADPGFTPAAVPGFEPRAAILPDGDIFLNGPPGETDGFGTFQLTRLQPSGAIDPVPQPSGVSTVNDLLPLQGGAVVIGGSFSSLNDQLRHSLASVQPDGSVDPLFHPDATDPSTVRRVIPLSGGRWLVTGDFTGALTPAARGRHVRVSRLTPSFQPDAAFQQSLLSSLLMVRAAAEDSSGRLLIGGDTNISGGGISRRMFRLNPNGERDLAFNLVLGGADVIRDIVILPDNRILAAGAIALANGLPQKNLVRMGGDGVVDTTFKPVLSAPLNDIALESGGRILAAGNGFLKRLQPDGAADSGFNQALVFNGNIHAVAALPGQRSIVAGDFTALNGVAAGRIARLTAAGDPDTTFQPGSGANGAILTLQVRSDGDLFIAGDFTVFNGQPRQGIAQLTPDGALRPGFDPGEGFNGSVKSLALAPDGHILAGGFFTRAGGANRSGFARIEAAPLQSVTPAPAAPGGLTATAISSKAILLIWTAGPSETGYLVERREIGAADWITVARPSAGSTFHRDDTVFPGKHYEYRVAAWNAGGESSATLTPETAVPPRDGLAGSLFQGSDLDLWNAGEMSAAAVQPDGKILVAGMFTRVNGLAKSSLVRLNTNGTLDSTFDAGTGATGGNSTGNVEAIGVQSTGRIILCGTFTHINGIAKPTIAGLLPGGSLDSTFSPPADLRESSVIAVLPDNKLIVGCGFTQPFLRRLMADGTLDTTYNSFASDRVSGLAIQPDGKAVITVKSGQVQRLLVNGSQDTTFAIANLGSTGEVVTIQADGKILVGGEFLTVNGVARSRIARLNSNGSLDTGFLSPVGADSTVNSITELANGKLAVGGAFKTYAGQNRTGLAVISATGALDASDAALGCGQVRTTRRLADGGVVILGNFSSVAGQPRLGFARLGSDGFTLNQGVAPYFSKPGTARSIFKQPDGKALVIGDFASIGGAYPNGLFRPTILRIEADGSVDDEFDAGSGFSAQVYGVSVKEDGRIFAGGEFRSVNGVSRTRIAALQANGQVDIAFNPGSGANNTIFSIAHEADGGATVAGNFSTINGQPRARLARLDANGLPTPAFQGLAGPNQNVSTIFRQPGGKLVIGGSFSTVHGVSRTFLARLLENGTVDPAFAPLPDGLVKAVLPGPALTVLAGGSFATVSGTPRARVVRLTESGNVDLDFAPALATSTAAPSTFNAIARDADDRLYVAGTWAGSLPLRTPGLLRLLANGAIDHSFDAGTSGSAVNGLATTVGGLLAGGSFETWEGQQRFG